MTNESKLTAQIIRRLAERRKAGEPIFYFKIHGGPQQRAGLPDLFVCYRGRAFFFEVKAKGGKVSPLQEHTMLQIEAAQGTARPVWSVAEVEEALI